MLILLSTSLYGGGYFKFRHAPLFFEENSIQTPRGCQINPHVLIPYKYSFASFGLCCKEMFVEAKNWTRVYLSSQDATYFGEYEIKTFEKCSRIFGWRWRTMQQFQAKIQTFTYISRYQSLIQQSSHCQPRDIYEFVKLIPTHGDTLNWHSWRDLRDDDLLLYNRKIKPMTNAGQRSGETWIYVRLGWLVLYDESITHGQMKVCSLYYLWDEEKMGK